MGLYPRDEGLYLGEEGPYLGEEDGEKAIPSTYRENCAFEIGDLQRPGLRK